MLQKKRLFTRGRIGKNIFNRILLCGINIFMQMRLTLSLLILLNTVHILNAQEIFAPSDGIVLDYSITEDAFIIQTTRGNFERIADYQYIRTDKRLDKAKKASGHLKTIAVLKDDKLYIPQKKSFRRSFLGAKVRFNDERFVGTFDGVFISGNKVQHSKLTYCDGVIRSFRDTTYICYDGLAIALDNKVLQIFSSQLEATLSFDSGQTNYGRLQDIWIRGGKKILLTNLGLFAVNRKNEIDTLFFQAENSNKQSPGGRFIEIAGDDLEGFYNNVYFKLNLVTDSVKVMATLNNVIYNISKGEYLFITTSDGIYSILEDEQDFILEGNFHGCIQHNGQFYAYSNDGLFSFNPKQKKKELEQLIQFEFNKHSASIYNDSLRIGSQDGLWSFALDSMPLPMAKIEPKPSKLITMQNGLIFCLTLGLVLSVRVNYASKKKRKTKYDFGITRNSQKTDIIHYIEENMASVTIVSLRSHFNLSQKKLYTICEPDPPGKIIRDIRLIRMKELLSRGLDYKTIAKETGFSVEYMRRRLLKEINVSNEPL